MKIVSLPAHLIGARSGARRVDKNKAAMIAESIREIGLLSPIIVVPGKRFRAGCEVDGWDILAGQHRFAAMFDVLRWEDIPCVVHEGEGLQLELVMIDENLARQELTDAERARQLCRRKEIYETLHPETVNGATGERKILRQNGEVSQAGRFTKATAEATGESERTIQRAVARGEALGGDIERVRGTSLDKAVELDALAKLPEAERRPLIDRAQAGEVVSARRPFRVAADPLEDAQASEKQVARLMDAWNAAGPEARQEFMLRIDPPVMDRRFG